MTRVETLDGVNGGTPVQLGAQQIETLMRDAETALSRSGNPGPARPGKPVLVAYDIASPVRLPNLIPDDWHPALTQSILRAVERHPLP